MSEYASHLVEKVKDEESWPSVDRDHLTKLQQIAINAFESGTVEGQLACILVCHQLAEELLRLLLAQSNFYTQLMLYPVPFEPKQTRKLMFGGILDLVKHAAGFQNKQWILEDAAELNSIRIKIAHGLIEPRTLEGISADSKRALSLFSKIQWHGLESYSAFNEAFLDFHADPKWPPRHVKPHPESFSYKG